MRLHEQLLCQHVLPLWSAAPRRRVWQHECDTSLSGRAWHHCAAALRRTRQHARDDETGTAVRGTVDNETGTAARGTVARHHVGEYGGTEKCAAARSRGPME